MKLVTVTQRAPVVVAPAAVAIIMAVVVTSGTAILPVIPVPVFTAMVIMGTPVVAPLSIMIVVTVKVMFFSIMSVTAAVGVEIVMKAALLLVHSGVLHLKNRLVPHQRCP